MSSILTSLVPVFDGSNFAAFTTPMQSYLMSQGLWYTLTQTQPAAGENDRADWDSDNLKALGNLRLRLSTPIAFKVSDFTKAAKVWDFLKDNYGKPGVAAVFTDFKLAMGITVPSDTHPGPAINNMIMYFDRVMASDIEIPDFIQAMIIISKLPPRYTLVAQSFSQIKMSDHSQLTPKAVQQAVVHSWEGRAHTHDNGSGKRANKLSAVKRKRDDPNFQQQQQQPQRPSGSSGNAGSAGKKPRGKRGGKKKHQQANEASGKMEFAAPTVLTEPSAKDVCRPFYQEPPRVRDGFFPHVAKAIDLARDLDVTPTIQTVAAL